jgi:uncharacterized protein
MNNKEFFEDSVEPFFLGDWIPPTHPEEQVRELIRAIINSDLKIIQELLDQGVEVNQEIEERSPLSVAIEENKLDIAQILIDAGANINWSFEHTSLLTGVSGEGDLEVVKLLIKAGADLELKDSDGHTALYRAALNERHFVYSYLFDLTKPSDYRDWVDKVVRPNAKKTIRGF